MKPDLSELKAELTKKYLGKRIWFEVDGDGYGHNMDLDGVVLSAGNEYYEHAEELAEYVCAVSYFDGRCLIQSVPVDHIKRVEDLSTEELLTHQHVLVRKLACGG